MQNEIVNAPAILEEIRKNQELSDGFEDDSTSEDQGEPFIYDEMMLAVETDGLLMRIFGDIPDYTDDDLDNLFEEVMEADEGDIYDYCRKHGVEVLDEDGEPVPPWRDIAVMLMAIDKGLIEKA